MPTSDPTGTPVPFPVTDAPSDGAAAPWSALDADGKRARALEVAGELFAREGLDASMPALAEAIGVGVGSIYRQIGRKEDVIALLVVSRLERLAEQLESALAQDDPWVALCDVTHHIISETVEDHVRHAAWVVSLDHPAVLAVRPRVAEGLDAVVARARDHGALREDATADDLRLAFRAAMEVESLGEGRAHRLADLVLRAMAAGDPDGR